MANVIEVIGILRRQAAELVHVLLLGGVDDRAGAEEEHRLEEAVDEEVEHRRRHGVRAERDEHQAERVQRRVGDHTLDVGRGEAHRRRHHDGGQAEDRDDVQRDRVGDLEDGQHARHHVDAGDDHRRGVDQRGDRRRALHRVGEPDVQRELAGLADRALNRKSTATVR